MRKAKNDYYSSVSHDLKNQSASTKQWWRLCKFLYSGKSVDHQIPPLLHNDEVITSDADKANIFNSYFTSISCIDESALLIPDNIPVCDSSLHEVIISEQDVTDVIKCLKLDKACGPDHISHKLLKESLPVISKPLANLFNISLSKSIFPSCWKIANVVPIFKGKEPHFAKNYRPISLLSCVSKVFERCIFKVFFNYLRDHNLLSHNQSAYTPTDSTVNQLVSIYHETCLSLDQNIDTQLIFFDISKAFDRVWHPGLLFKLKSIGIGGKLLKWFRSYLTKRHQQVVLNGKSSRTMELQSGVPQGSVLGPIMFLVYINDISSSIVSTTKLYADDTSLLHRITDINSKIELQNDLNTIDKWSEQWAVTFNPSKSHALHISRKREHYNTHDYIFQNRTIENVNEHTHLGLIWNSECNWKNHLIALGKRGSQRVDILRSLKYRLDRNTLEIIYKSFIRPIFEYASVVWHNAPRLEKYCTKLEQLQLDAARTVTGTNRNASKQLLYCETGWETLSNRREKQRLILFYKIVNGLAPRHLENTLHSHTQHTHGHYTRQQDNIRHILARTDTYRNSFFPHSIRLWNNLNSSIRTASSLNTFKSSLNLVYAVPKRNPYYSLGSRSVNSILSSMRTKCSQLKNDLFQNGILLQDKCTCGLSETQYHYFFECGNYTIHRDRLIMETLHICRLTLSIILHGNPDSTTSENKILFNAVSKYVIESKRFGCIN